MCVQGEECVVVMVSRVKSVWWQEIKMSIHEGIDKTYFDANIPTEDILWNGAVVVFLDASGHPAFTAVDGLVFVCL
jgi:hypothetical protein